MNKLDLKISYACDLRCKFCVVASPDYIGSGIKPPTLSAEELIAALKEGYLKGDRIVTFTGGEPTLFPYLPKLCRMAKLMGFKVIQIQTHGGKLMNERLARELIDAGANEFAPSIHGAEAATHDYLTGIAGSHERTIAGVHTLKRLGQRVIMNTVVTSLNYKEMPRLAEMMVEWKVDQFQLAFLHIAGTAVHYKDWLVPRKAEAMPWVRRALAIGHRHNLPCMTDGVPFCHMQGFEQCLAQDIMPETFIQGADGMTLDSYKTDRKDNQRAKGPGCKTCTFYNMCEGPWKEYPMQYGWDEFVPVHAVKIGDAAPDFELLSDAGRKVKLSDSLGRQVILYFYPEDDSPGCTVEACGFRDLVNAKASDAVILGVSPDSVDSHVRFKKKHALPFTLLSDPDHEGGLAYRVYMQGRGLERATFTIGADGRVEKVFRQVEPNGHAQRVLELLRETRQKLEAAVPS